MSRKILIVEDDAPTASYLAKGLAEAGYRSRPAPTGATGCSWRAGHLRSHHRRRMLPGLDGLAMVSAVRAAGIATPTLVLSALASVDDRVDGLRAGRRRLSLQALFVRRTVRADRGAGAAGGAQRRRAAEDASWRSAIWRSTCWPHVTRAGRTIPLGAREFTCSISRPPRRPGRDPHDDAERSGTIISIRSNVVDVHIGRLRRKLEDGFPDADPAHRARRRLSPFARGGLIPRRGCRCSSSLPSRVGSRLAARIAAGTLRRPTSSWSAFVWRHTHGDAVDALRRETRSSSPTPWSAVYRTRRTAPRSTSAIANARAPGDLSLLRRGAWTGRAAARRGRADDITAGRRAGALDRLPHRRRSVRASRASEREAGYAVRPRRPLLAVVSGRLLDDWQTRNSAESRTRCSRRSCSRSRSGIGGGLVVDALCRAAPQ